MRFDSGTLILVLFGEIVQIVKIVQYMAFSQIFNIHSMRVMCRQKILKESQIAQIS